jgi:hypothetical protein
MASANFTILPRTLATAGINFSSATLKVMLVSSVPSGANLDAWAFRADVTNEITGTGYTAGGIAQPFTFPALDTTNNKQSIVLTDISSGWTSATFTAFGCIVYQDTGSAATDKLIFFGDFLGGISVSAGSFSIDYTSALDIFA